MKNHKSGFVAIIGKPNVGKSTLMNQLLGESLSVVTPKAQTTRHRIKGILNNPDYQMVFSDTPGIMKPAYKLHDRMVQSVDSSLADADVIMMVVEAGESVLSDDVAGRLEKSKVPLVVVINKIDLADQETLEQRVAYWQSALSPEAIVPVSALESFNIDKLIETILNFLPEGEPYFDKEDLSDRNVRFFVEEIIREQILLQYKKEVPYSCEVKVNEYKESENIDRIRCEIFVDRESQKAIILGHKGAAIKSVGIASRKKIEKFVDKQVYLELTVKVRSDWRDNEKMLDQFGYKPD
jgi:GTPase